MLNWHDWAACCAPILDTTPMTSQLKFTICVDTESPVIKPQHCPSVLDTIDTSKMQFTSLGLKDLKNTGVFPSRTNSWKWNLS